MTPEELRQAYEEQKLSIPQLSVLSGRPQSTVRYWLLKAGCVLRSRRKGVKLRGAYISAVCTGRKRGPMPEETRAKLRAAVRPSKAVGVTVAGYLRHTRKADKHKLAHRRAMEEHLGRPLSPREVIHHKDRNKQNNSIDNLQIMSRSEHQRLHALEDHTKRKRDQNGRFC